MIDHATAVELRALVEAYASAVDRRDAPTLSVLFEEEAVLTTPTSELRGRAAIGRIPERLDARYRVTHHLVGGQRLENGPSAAAATGTVECLAKHVYAHEEGERVYVMHIRYHDRYRHDGGRWRFAERRLELLWDEDHPLRS